MSRKKTPKQKLKDEADTAFSEYIRLKYADWRGYVACYTCGKTHFWAKDGMQNGHFVSRGSNTLRFSERNCRPQCVGCNVFKKGNYIEYTMRIIEEVGLDEVEELRKIGKEIKQFTEQELLEIRDDYRRKVAELKTEKCYERD